MTEEIAFFGGSFNPPHVGHLLAVAYVLAVHRVDRALIVPAFHHPFNKELIAFEHRAEMAALAFADVGRAEVSTIERDLGAEVSRTLDTIEALRARLGNARLRLVIGTDVLHDKHKWHRFDRIVELAPPIVIGRAGVSHPDAPAAVLPEVSSTAIRGALARGELDAVLPLLPWRVLEYVLAHRLYQAKAPET
jgi:nicotinate-nucleotide adenylyltransferase